MKPTMKKICVLTVGTALLIIGSFAYAGCQQKSMYHNTTIEFPASTYQKTENNAAIFDIEPFALHLNIPIDWELKVPESDSEVQSDLWSPVGIYKNDVLIGSIGYNTFDYYPEAGDNPVAVYGQLMLGSIVNWNNDYTQVKKSNTLNTATCKIARTQVEPGMAAASSIVYSQGILAHDNELLVYIGIEIDEGVLTSEELEMLVGSISLAGNKDGAQDSDNEESGASEQGLKYTENIASMRSDGLTNEEYEELQAQKAKFEAMTEEEKQVAMEGGTIGCKKFIHLWWEESIEVRFIRYVGEEAFNEWINRNRDSNNCTNIYNFAEEFGLDYYTLRSIVTENHLEEIYPLDRLETRYNFFRNSTVEWEEHFVTPGPEDFCVIEVTGESRVFDKDNTKVTFAVIPASEAERVVTSMLFYYATNDAVRREATRLEPEPVDLNNPWLSEPQFASFTVLDIKTMSEADILNEVRPAFEAESLATQGMFDGFLTIGEYIEKYKLIDPIVITVDETFTYTEATRRRGPQLADDTQYRRYYILSKNGEGAYRIADYSFVW